MKRMVEKRRAMHLQCEYRRRGMIQNGLAQLSEILRQDQASSRLKVSEPAHNRRYLSRPEILLGTVRKIEELRVSVRSLELQEQKLREDTLQLRKLALLQESPHEWTSTNNNNKPSQTVLQPRPQPIVTHTPRRPPSLAHFPLTQPSPRSINHRKH